MKKTQIHITIHDDIDPEEAVRRVAHVISGGKISKDSKRDYYCFLTTWNDGIAVSVNQYVKSDCFQVWKRKTQNTCLGITEY